MDAPEYYKTRLDHTLQHTQQATRLIYFVNGGVATMAYFAFGKLGAYSEIAISLLFLLLGAINLIHSRLIKRQGLWYRTIDEAFAASIPTRRVDLTMKSGTTHDLYASIHRILSAASFVAAAAFLIAQIVEVDRLLLPTP